MPTFLPIGALIRPIDADPATWDSALARRRRVKVARATATLEPLSDVRLTLGVGAGSDRFGSEFSITGEELDDCRRASGLDESLEILTGAPERRTLARWPGSPLLVPVTSRKWMGSRLGRSSR